MVTLLEVEHLTKVFRRRRLRKPAEERRAVDDVSFSLEHGKTLAVVGESGAGKSTCARLVMRLIEPDGGTVVFDGCDLLGLSTRELRARRRTMQMIFQDPYSSLDPRMTIGYALAEPLRVHTDLSRTDREARVAALIQRVGLGSHHLDRMPHQLSGGQLQRVSIARALTLDPKLLVLDEAVAALDVSVRAQVLNLLLDLQEERRMSYLFIAHDLSIVEAFADDVLVMRSGKAVESGPVADVYDRPKTDYVKELLAAVPALVPKQRVGAAAAG